MELRNLNTKDSDILKVVIRFISMSNPSCNALQDLIKKIHNNDMDEEKLEENLNQLENDMRESKESIKIEVQNIKQKNGKQIETSSFFKQSRIPCSNPRLRKVSKNQNFTVCFNSKQDALKGIEFIKKNYLYDDIGFTDKSKSFLEKEDTNRNQFSQFIEKVIQNNFNYMNKHTSNEEESLNSKRKSDQFINQKISSKENGCLPLKKLKTQETDLSIQGNDIQENKKEEVLNLESNSIASENQDQPCLPQKELQDVQQPKEETSIQGTEVQNTQLSSASDNQNQVCQLEDQQITQDCQKSIEEALIENTEVQNYQVSSAVSDNQDQACNPENKPNEYVSVQLKNETNDLNIQNNQVENNQVNPSASESQDQLCHSYNQLNTQYANQILQQTGIMCLENSQECSSFNQQNQENHSNQEIQNQDNLCDQVIQNLIQNAIEKNQHANQEHFQVSQSCQYDNNHNQENILLNQETNSQTQEILSSQYSLLIEEPDDIEEEEIQVFSQSNQNINSQEQNQMAQDLTQKQEPKTKHQPSEIMDQPLNNLELLKNEETQVKQDNCQETNQNIQLQVIDQSNLKEIQVKVLNDNGYSQDLKQLPKADQKSQLQQANKVQQQKTISQSQSESKKDNNQKQTNKKVDKKESHSKSQDQSKLSSNNHSKDDKKKDKPQNKKDTNQKSSSKNCLKEPEKKKSINKVKDQKKSDKKKSEKKQRKL